MPEPRFVICQRAEPDSQPYESETEPASIEVDGSGVLLLLDDGTELTFEREALLRYYGRSGTGASRGGVSRRR
jgi:hypothetical protein